MSKDEIMALKPGIDLDREVSRTIFDSTVTTRPGVKCYSTNISQAFEMAEEIARQGLIEEFGDWITLLVLSDNALKNARQKMFALAHASPEIRCKAALLAKTMKE